MHHPPHHGTNNFRHRHHGYGHGHPCLRRTDEYDKFLFFSSVRHHGCALVADAGVEAWTCDGKTNAFFSSVRHHGCVMVADAGGEAWTCNGQTNAINFIKFVCPSPNSTKLSLLLLLLQAIVWYLLIALIIDAHAD